MLTNTAIFPWNSNFETGIAEIDEQHRKLVDLLNILARKLAYGTDVHGLGEIFDELSAYAAHHFQTEEAIWREFLPTDELAEEHETSHHAFVTEVLKIRAAQEGLPSDQAIEEIVLFLTHWLAFHILESDKFLAKIVLLVRQGVSLDAAKEKAAEEMSGATQVLLETILTMYDSLSSRTLLLMREVAERARAEEKLRLSRSVIDSTLEAIFITDAEGRVIDTNPAFRLEVQVEQAQIAGMNIRQLKPDFFSHEKTLEIWQMAREQGHWAGEMLSRDAKGDIDAIWLSLSVIKNAQGEITNYVGLSSSISQLITRQESLEKAVQHDVLTGLPNRRLLHDRLGQAIMHCSRSGSVLAVCYLDLDGFKQINDTMGHDAGDAVLRCVSARLARLLRAEDTVARLGGDEFVILFCDLSCEQDVKPLLDRLLSDISRPMEVHQATALVTASIGVAFYPCRESTAEQLIKHADEAMYVAKNNGKSRYHVYTS